MHQAMLLIAGSGWMRSRVTVSVGKTKRYAGHSVWIK